MRFQTDLVPARLIRRYKRFLADCTLEVADSKGLTEIVAHCANPGSMLGLAEAGTRVWLEPNDDPKKKLKYGLRLVDHENGHFTGVDTSLPNRVLRAALEAGKVGPLAAYASIQPEVKYGENSRVDFLLRGDGLPDAYVEVKSVTLCRAPALAEFPDSVTARGTKHMNDLADVARAGHRAVLIYLVQRTDCTHVDIAADIDPKYAAAHAAATAAGVETIALGTHITPQGIDITGPLALGRPPR
ncbi:DNA/RNA nuclease SfsA [uncultured Sulfitobacter sp.]|uniref:DNA/RNA nuclease SfsA n=1 Tax=uncultured Sulfitobacter sp. TaxID=191468 RepID=UPI002609E313|nr:DNA/RNA nuclease SfsA [uncultured Sulfitobacter sp.]